MASILMVAGEGLPFIKTGGLADVIGSLPKALTERGHEVKVVMPLYKKISDKYYNELHFDCEYSVSINYHEVPVRVFSKVVDNVCFFFIQHQGYFERDSLYGYKDDGERFGFFQMAALELMEKVDFIPDILHVHDYHTAMIPFLLKEKYHWIQAYQGIKTVFTIHNIEFQGQFDSGMLWEIFGVGYERYADGTLRWNDCLNWMKAAVLYADRVTTVSPSYAGEIQTPEFGKGLDQIMRMESGKLSGIVNGIDTDLLDPETDTHIPYHFSVDDLSGKAKDKAALQDRVGLPVREDVPLIGIVSRLTDQKGFDLVVNELHNILQHDVQIVLLGTGYSDYENSFSWFAHAYPEKMSANITFNLELAQQIYAGCDIFLMPSAFEPCGLSQMMSMRYGTLPVVSEVGGLRDTVEPYNPVTGSGTGFSFGNFSGYWMVQTLEKALDVYENNADAWKQLQHNAMTRDFSWDTASLAYVDLYKQLV